MMILAIGRLLFFPLSLFLFLSPFSLIRAYSVSFVTHDARCIGRSVLASASIGIDNSIYDAIKVLFRNTSPSPPWAGLCTINRGLVRSGTPAAIVNHRRITAKLLLSFSFLRELYVVILVAATRD